MNLLRHVALVSGLLLGVTYSVVSYVETRRPLPLAPQVVEQELLGSDAAESAQPLPIDHRIFSTRDHVPRSQVRATTKA